MPWAPNRRFHPPIGEMRDSFGCTRSRTARGLFWTIDPPMPATIIRVMKTTRSLPISRNTAS